MIRPLVSLLLALLTSYAVAAPETFTRTVSVDDHTVELKITIDFDHLDEKATALAKTLPDAYFDQWSQIALMIDAPLERTPKHLGLSFKKDMGHPAHVAGSRMVISASHASNHPDDVAGVFTHELTHVVQFYPGGSGAPGWFTEGLADLVRYRIHPDSRWAVGNIKATDKEKALGAYWQSSAFLLWMEQTYDKPIAAMVSRSCSDGSYDATIWKRETGKTLDELAEAYQKSDWRAPGEPIVRNTIAK